MKAMTLRGIDEGTYQAIRECSEKAHMSMNKFVVNMLKGAVGGGSVKENIEFDDFFGTWKGSDCQNFIEQVKPLQKIDKDLWS